MRVNYGSTNQSWQMFVNTTCSIQGHIREGISTNTNPERTIWADHCSRCGVKL